MKHQHNSIFILGIVIIVVGACSGNKSYKPSSENVNNSVMNKSQSNDQSNLNISSDEQRTSNTGVGKIIINGIALNELMETEFERIYRVKPVSGNYWYDTNSGLWGKSGGQALGFIFPGHQYGKLSRNASNGNTGIIINGRELPMTEVLMWQQITRVPAQPGRYWFDGRGNLGYEGSPYALLNLHVMANQNSYQGQPGGDNFWTSRFSAGNSDGNSGYVSVPGYGPVGYGDY